MKRVGVMGFPFWVRSLIKVLMVLGVKVRGRRSGFGGRGALVACRIAVS